MQTFFYHPNKVILSFPGMETEVGVNLLGYKEPRLVGKKHIFLGGRIFRIFQSNKERNRPERPLNTLPMEESIPSKPALPVNVTNIESSFLKRLFQVHVMRCQGLCHLGVACVPSSVDRRTITMMLKTSHTGSEARTEKQEVALEEHLACACDCDQQEEQECSGRWEKILSCNHSISLNPGGIQPPALVVVQGGSLGRMRRPARWRDRQTGTQAPAPANQG